MAFVDQASGRQIVTSLKGKWRGSRGGMCRCPAHDDRTPSLSVHEKYGRVLVRCFAGCSQERVLDALRARGLWPDRDYFGVRIQPQKLPLPTGELDNDERALREAARKIFLNAQPPERTPVSLYLYTRGIELRTIPVSIRYVPELWHSKTKTSWPALVAAVQNLEGRVIAIQRIWLQDKFWFDDGRPITPNTKAPIESEKMSLGPLDAGAVHLGPARVATLGIAEGIETALAAKCLYGIPVWAALGVYRMGRVEIPPHVRRIVIFGDRDGSGKVGEREAYKARDSYIEQGLDSEVVFPPEEYGDFDDWLIAERYRREALAEQQRPRI